MSDLKQTVGFLHKIPLFQGLNNRQYEHLAKRMVERSYDAGHAIVNQDQGGEGFFIIVSGKAEAFRERADGAKGRPITLVNWPCWMMGCAPLRWLLLNRPPALYSRVGIFWARCAKMWKYPF
jgi:hypothetical protein